jgi:hypothetical protein
MKVYGIKVVVNNLNTNKKILIYGILDDVLIGILNNKFITTKTKQLNEVNVTDSTFDMDTFKKFITSLTLKEYLINNTSNDIIISTNMLSN